MKTARYLLFISAAGFVAAFQLAGCPPHPAPRPLPPQPTFAPLCSTSLLVPPTADDVCDSTFTNDGWACVNCAGAYGCFDATDGIYCVTGGCLNDPACVTRPTRKNAPKD